MEFVLGENIKKKEWVRHFAKLLAADNGELVAETGQRIVQSWEGEGERIESMDKRLDEKITRQELQKVIRAFENKKAPGEDGLTVEFIKAMPTERIEGKALVAAEHVINMKEYQ